MDIGIVEGEWYMNRETKNCYKVLHWPGFYSMSFPVSTDGKNIITYKTSLIRNWVHLPNYEKTLTIQSEVNKLLE